MEWVKSTVYEWVKFSMAIWGVEEYGGDLPRENLVPQKHSPPVSFQAQPVAWSQTTDMENLEKSKNILVSKPCKTEFI